MPRIRTTCGPSPARLGSMLPCSLAAYHGLKLSVAFRVSRLPPGRRARRRLPAAKAHLEPSDHPLFLARCEVRRAYRRRTVELAKDLLWRLTVRMNRIPALSSCLSKRILSILSRAGTVAGLAATGSNGPRVF